MLYLIGLGIWDEKDISERGIEAIKKCDAVYMEQYTVTWFGSVARIEKITGKKVLLLLREKVESDFLIDEAKKKKIALLVAGDPLAATTHFQLIYEAKRAGIDFMVIHASSIYTAVALTGLQLYKFGRITTLAKPQPSFKPESPYDIILENKAAGLHTLVLLDTAGGGMTITEGLKLLKSMEEKRGGGVFSEKIIAAARLGSEKPVIKYGYADGILSDDKPGVIIIPGALNFKEEEALAIWQ